MNLLKKVSVYSFCCIVFLTISCTSNEPAFMEGQSSTPNSESLGSDPRLLQTSCNISGKSATCLSSETYYASYGGFNSPTLKWSILSGSGLSISGSSTSSSVKLNFSSNFTSGSLLLEITEGVLSCSKVKVISKDDVPARPGIIKNNEYPNGTANYTICSYDLANSEFYVNPVSGAASYEWKIVPSTNVNMGTSSNYVDYLYAPPGNYSLDVRAINSCGAGSWSGVGVTIVQCGGPGGF
ncbi:hypothetical protein [Fulvivirga kasyanovii]|uniref:hypothetical protein n=2 Tax=Fulvivirga kasyanovii TaxID=396812 RepID=UPI0031D93AB3